MGTPPMLRVKYFNAPQMLLKKIIKRPSTPLPDFFLFTILPLLMHNRGTPVKNPAPPGGAQPKPLSQIKYNIDGIHNVRRHCGTFLHEPGVYNANRSCFDAADLAWIATFLSLASNSKLISANSLPPEFAVLRDGMSVNSGETRAVMRTQLQKLVFDLVCVFCALTTLC